MCAGVVLEQYAAEFRYESHDPAMRRRARSGTFTVASYSSVIHIRRSSIATVPGEPTFDGRTSDKTATSKATFVAAVRDSITTRIADRAVRSYWVGGHSGHHLNDTAGKPVVAIRRNYEAGVPTEARVEIADFVSWLRGMGVA